MFFDSCGFSAKWRHNFQEKNFESEKRRFSTFLIRLRFQGYCCELRLQSLLFIIHKLSDLDPRRIQIFLLLDTSEHWTVGSGSNFSNISHVLGKVNGRYQKFRTVSHSGNAQVTFLEKRRSKITNILIATVWIETFALFLTDRIRICFAWPDKMILFVLLQFLELCSSI